MSPRTFLIDTRPLRHATFRRTWIGNGVAGVGFQLTAVAVPVEMYAITDSSVWVGLIGIAGLVPLLIFALLGGAVADAVDRRKVLLASSLVTWVVTLALFIQAVLGLDSPVLLLCLVAVQAIGFALTFPVRQAIVPRIVPVEDVAAAQTITFTTSNGAMVLGPLLAALIIGKDHFAAAYAVDAALFTVSLWASLRLPALPPEHTGAAPVTVGLRAVTDGLRYLATTPIIALSFAVDLVAMVFAMPRALFPEMADERFGAGSVGWLFSAIALGAVAGGLVSGWIGRVRRQGLALVGAVVVWGLAIAAAGVAHQLWLAVLFLAVAGMGDLVSGVYRQTIMAVHAPDEMRGRLQGVFTAVVAGGPRLGDLRAGLSAALVGPSLAWAGGGVAAAVIVVVLALAFPVLPRYDGRPPAAHAEPAVEAEVQTVA
ncbi:MFS transporter [Luedemannella flava]|uniref:MFS transporter n=1 Tax=Luedemannella flava TaxID=349316 RepID=A0ABP4YF21_9ACTN